MCDAEKILLELIQKLPTCWRCSREGLPLKVATFWCLDAASDGMYCCDEHATPGGYDGDEGPFPVKWSEPLKQAVTHFRLMGIEIEIDP